MAGNLGTFFQDLHEGVKRGLRAGRLDTGVEDSGWPGGDEGPSLFPGAHATLPAWPGLSGPSPFPGAGGSSGFGGGGGQPFDLLGNIDQSHYAAQAEAQAAQQRSRPESTYGPALAGEGFGNPDDYMVERQLGGRGVPSPMAGDGAWIKQIADREGVPVAVALAIMAQESGYGTDRNDLTAANNYFGLSGQGDAGSVTIVGPDGKARTFAKFSSPRAGTEAAIRNMAGEQYRNLPLGQYLALYLTGDPNGATDGAGNYTADYVKNAQAVIYNLGGNADANSVVVRSRAGGAVPPSQIAARTQQWVGKVGYTSGGVRNTGNIADGADCSSWAGYLIGADPSDWNAQALYNTSDAVSPDQLQPGDLVFFDIANPGDPTARPVGHVAVWLGNGQISQSTTMNGTNGVQITSLSQDSYLAAHIYGYGRYRGRGSSAEGNR